MPPYRLDTLNSTKWRDRSKVPVKVSPTGTVKGSPNRAVKVSPNRMIKKRTVQNIKSRVQDVVIVRTRKEVRRADGTYVRFGQNGAVLIKKDGTPIGTRVFGPDNLGKITERMTSVAFPKNDGTLLVNAIFSAKEVTSGTGTASAAAMARAPQQPEEVREYLGRVISIKDDEVIAEIGPYDEMDRWEVIIPRASFDERPQIDHEISCKITSVGSQAFITVQVLSRQPLPELKDFGIEEEELLSWASQLDV